MKKAILIFITAILTVSITSAGEKYMQKMGETISQFSSMQSIEDYQILANKFNNIANVESTEWLPLYYEAQCYIMMSFMDRQGSEKKDEYLKMASPSIERMLELAPAESEAYTMLALYYTSRMVVNPPERSQKNAPLIGAALGKALGIDPENPRAIYLQLSNEMGTARYFGSDVGAMCQQAEKLLAQWDSYAPISPIHPSWGKNLVEQMVRECGE